MFADFAEFRLDRAAPAKRGRILASFISVLFECMARRFVTLKSICLPLFSHSCSVCETKIKTGCASFRDKLTWLVEILVLDNAMSHA